jgi:hypothetical protein
MVQEKRIVYNFAARRVNVTFEKVKVWDDSDDLGDGDLGFAFRINGNLSPNGKDLIFAATIGTGQSKSINMQATILNPGSTMKINVTGFDNDAVDVFVLNSCGKVPVGEKENSGEEDCGEWTGKSRTYSTTILADGEDPNAPVTESITLKAYPTEDDSELAFEITGKYTISYVP